MELKPGDGQICIVKSDKQNYKVSECQRLANIANGQGHKKLEDFTSISTLTQALHNRYNELPSFEIHVMGFSEKEQQQIDKLKEKMKNLEQIRFIKKA